MLYGGHRNRLQRVERTDRFRRQPGRKRKTSHQIAASSWLPGKYIRQSTSHARDSPKRRQNPIQPLRTGNDLVIQTRPNDGLEPGDLAIGQGSAEPNSDLKLLAF